MSIAAGKNISLRHRVAPAPQALQNGGAATCLISLFLVILKGMQRFLPLVSM